MVERLSRLTLLAFEQVGVHVHREAGAGVP
jgi:hypothetical protein